LSGKRNQAVIGNKVLQVPKELDVIGTVMEAFEKNGRVERLFRAELEHVALHQADRLPELAGAMSYYVQKVLFGIDRGNLIAHLAEMESRRAPARPKFYNARPRREIHVLDQVAHG